MAVHLENGAKRVLIVEDDVGMKSVLMAMLNSIGFKVVVDWCQTGDEALAHLNERGEHFATHYDLVVADIFLPGNTTGIDLWEKWRERNPRMPFLITSGMTKEQFEDSLLTFDEEKPAFLSKALPLENRRQILRSLLTP
jgi:DNA-binding NtrC family response regulator